MLQDPNDPVEGQTDLNYQDFLRLRFSPEARSLYDMVENLGIRLGYRIELKLTASHNDIEVFVFKAPSDGRIPESP